MADLEYAFLADAADAQPGQKFAVIGGGVSRIGGAVFPLRHPHLALVVGLQLDGAEIVAEHDVAFAVVTPDGAELAAAGARLHAESAQEPGESVLTFALDLWNLAFPQPGRYGIRILVDGDEKKRLPLIVEQQDVMAGDVPEMPVVPPFIPPTGRA